MKSLSSFCHKSERTHIRAQKLAPLGTYFFCFYSYSFVIFDATAAAVFAVLKN